MGNVKLHTRIATRETYVECRWKNTDKRCGHLLRALSEDYYFVSKSRGPRRDERKNIAFTLSDGVTLML